MKVSLNWVKQFTPVKLPVERLVEKIGVQLGAVEEVIDVGQRYKGIVVGKVVECKKHPNADKLSVCLVDDGRAAKGVKRNKQGLIEVVCGAPNVAAGQLIAYIPPGVVVPSSADKDPLKLESREIRGVTSHGMIASGHELALSDDHSGILVLAHEEQQATSNKQQAKPALKPGSPLAKVLGLDDVVIDIENKMFTHRPDLFGMLGVAREIAGIQGQPFKGPSWYKQDPALPKPTGRLKLVVKNSQPKLVPRFSAVAMRDVKVGPSPLWLQVRLSVLGVRPINNIVDITNYLMLLGAQPLHAYDYDKLKTGTLGTALAKGGESLKIIGGKTLKLAAGSLVITDGRRPIGLAGVMGGADTEVDAATRNIVIESANFDMTAVRKSAMTYGLFTDAATRFTKNPSPRQTVTALAEAVKAVQEMADGRLASPLVDSYAPTAKRPAAALQVSPDFINQRLGLALTPKKIRQLLENVEFKVAAVSGGRLLVAAPFWRTDIEIPEDIVEEVGRLYGYDHLPLELPRRDLAPAPKDPLLELKNQLREALAAAGANELLTYSFVDGRLLAAAGQDAKQAFHIRNALSPELQYYRLSLTPSLLEKVHPSIKQGFEEFVLFEIGKVHGKSQIDKDGLPIEFERLALVAASRQPRAGAPFYWARTYAAELIGALHQSVDFKPLSSFDISRHQMARQMVAPFAADRSAWLYVDGKLGGIVGEYRPEVGASLKLPAYSAGFEMFLSPLDPSKLADYQPLNRFPSLDQDLTLKVPVNLSYSEITAHLSDSLADQASRHGYRAELTPLDIFQKAGDKNHKQLTWRIVLAHPERTLTTAEANKLLDYLASQTRRQLGATRV